MEENTEKSEKSVFLAKMEQEDLRWTEEGNRAILDYALSIFKSYTSKDIKEQEEQEIAETLQESDMEKIMSSDQWQTMCQDIDKIQGVNRAIDYFRYQKILTKDNIQVLFDKIELGPQLIDLAQVFCYLDELGIMTDANRKIILTNPDSITLLKGSLDYLRLNELLTEPNAQGLLTHIQAKQRCEAWVMFAWINGAKLITQDNVNRILTHPELHDIIEAYINIITATQNYQPTQDDLEKLFEDPEFASDQIIAQQQGPAYRS